MRRLDLRFIKADRISWFIFTGVLVAGAIVAVVVLILSDAPLVALLSTLGGTLAGLLLMSWLSWMMPLWTHRHTSYRVDDDGIEIRKGIWWKKVINVPRSRIQHTDVDQGPLARRFELAKLTVHTAGTVNASVELWGLEHGDAMTIREELLRGSDGDGV